MVVYKIKEKTSGDLTNLTHLWCHKKKYTKLKKCSNYFMVNFIANKVNYKSYNK